MKCPKCGAEIDKVEMVESIMGSEVSEWVENKDGTFRFVDTVDSNTHDSQIEEIRCPECEEALKWHWNDKGNLVIDSGEDNAS